MAAPIRVLLIDDEPDFLDAISFWLTSKGYAVSTATSGAQGLELLQHDRFDVLFLDIVMPQIDGLEVLRRLRTLNKAIPVILVTASAEHERRFAGTKALGISGLFPKGGSLTELSQVLEVALRMIQKSAEPPSLPPQERPPVRKGLDLRGLFKRFAPHRS